MNNFAIRVERNTPSFHEGVIPEVLCTFPTELSFVMVMKARSNLRWLSQLLDNLLFRVAHLDSTKASFESLQANVPTGTKTNTYQQRQNKRFDRERFHKKRSPLDTSGLEGT